jgi:predicted RNase H-like HicB family nuclease
MGKQYQVQVLIHRGDNGYWATVAQLPGVFAAGETQAELMQCLEEAVELYLAETGVPPELEEHVEVQTFNLSGDRLIPA